MQLLMTLVAVLSLAINMVLNTPSVKAMTPVDTPAASPAVSNIAALVVTTKSPSRQCPPTCTVSPALLVRNSLAYNLLSVIARR